MGQVHSLQRLRGSCARDSGREGTRFRAAHVTSRIASTATTVSVAFCTGDKPRTKRFEVPNSVTALRAIHLPMPRSELDFERFFQICKRGRPHRSRKPPTPPPPTIDHANCNTRQQVSLLLSTSNICLRCGPRGGPEKLQPGSSNAGHRASSWALASKGEIMGPAAPVVGERFSGSEEMVRECSPALRAKGPPNRAARSRRRTRRAGRCGRGAADAGGLAF